MEHSCYRDARVRTINYEIALNFIYKMILFSIETSYRNRNLKLYNTIQSFLYERFMLQILGHKSRIAITEQEMINLR